MAKRELNGDSEEVKAAIEDLKRKAAGLNAADAEDNYEEDYEGEEDTQPREEEIASGTFWINITYQKSITGTFTARRAAQKNRPKCHFRLSASQPIIFASYR